MPRRLRAVLVFGLTVACLFATFSWRQAIPRSFSTAGPSYRLFNSTSPLPSSKFAIATFLTGQGKDDAYFTATRILTYQLLHAPETKLNSTDITFLVLCSSSLPVAQKRQLQRDGAFVVEVDDVPVNWWIYSGVRRWKEQFTKLRIFEMTEYQRVLYLDADILIMAPLDGVFEDPEVATLTPTLFSRESQIRKDESPLPAEWLFAARSDNAFTGERDHPVPPLQSSSFSAGFFMVAPDKKIYAHLLSVMSHFHRFDPFTMEQSLLNYVFRREGAMPWRELHWKWSATWPNEKDVKMGVASLHEKWWSTGPQALRNVWKKRKREMLEELGTNG